MSISKYLVDDFAGFSIDSSQTLTIPCDIIMEEILPRLPVKSLIRFKSVSKHWYFIISSCSFAKLRLKFSTACDNFLVIKSRLGPSFHLLPQKECSSVDELIGINPFTDESPHITLVDCCDGLVCFRYSGVFCVWNPVTRERRDVVNPGGDVGRARAYGFGYVSSLNDYLIVSSFGMKEDCTKWSGFYVFSLRDGNWKRIDGLDQNVGRPVMFNSVWIDGNLYWSPDSRLDLFQRSYHIIRFNFVEGELEKCPLTFRESNVCSDCSLIDLYPFKGCLALHSYKEDNTSNFWVLKNEDDWSSWEKLFTVNLGCISFIGLFDQGKCLLRHNDQFRLVDLCNETLEHVKRDFVGEGLDLHYFDTVKIASYTQSLVSPFRTTKPDGVETKDYEV